MEITLHKAAAAVKDIMQANLVANLVGSPGIGKSDIIKQVAAEFDLKVIDFRLAQADPTDLSGFPTLNADRSRCHYAPPITFPLAGDELPIKTEAEFDGANNLIKPATYYKGWLLFLDELTSAPQMVQAAAYKVILDRQVGEHDLHEQVRIVSAGNKASDKAIVQRMSTALQSRVVTLEIIINMEEWLSWAEHNGIDKRIMAYIQFRPDMLHKFNADHQDLTFPCPRTWEFAHRLLAIWGAVTLENLTVLAGTISKGAASELISFCQVYSTLPTLFEMENLIGASFSEDNSAAMVIVMNRLPIEFRVLACQNVLRRDPRLQREPNLKAMIRSNSSDLY